jgi:hypothetical protein
MNKPNYPGFIKVGGFGTFEDVGRSLTPQQASLLEAANTPGRLEATVRIVKAPKTYNSTDRQRAEWARLIVGSKGGVDPDGDQVDERTKEPIKEDKSEERKCPNCGFVLPNDF